MITARSRDLLTKSLGAASLAALLFFSAGCTAVNRTMPIQDTPKEVSRYGFIMPVIGTVTSPFGMRTLMGETKMHKGIDFEGKLLVTPVYAVRAGEVTIAARSKTYGQWIEIRHSGGFSTRYAHLTWSHVKRGKKVRRGDLIGRIGNSGRSTGSHLHFEVLLDGERIDPAEVLP